MVIQFSLAVRSRPVPAWYVKWIRSIPSRVSIVTFDGGLRRGRKARYRMSVWPMERAGPRTCREEARALGARCSLHP